MFRYNFNEKNIAAAKKFLKKESDNEPSFLKKFKGTIKKDSLFLDDKRVIPREKIEYWLRKWVLSGKMPLTRDGLYYYIQSQNVVGIPRAAIDKFLKKQKVINETDNAQPRTNKQSRKVNKKGQLAFDLVEINWDDLGFIPKEGKPKKKKFKAGKEVKQSKTDAYIFTCADALTGLVFCRYSPSKARRSITPIAKQCFDFFSKALGVPIDRLFAVSDSGKEFDFEKYKTWGVRLKQLPRSGLIENKNAQIQRALYRVAKMNTTNSIVELVKKAQSIVNRTQSSLTKKTPAEASKTANVDLAKGYNKKRGQDSGVKIKARPLKIGEKVRINLIGPKKTSFYKAYHAKTWSKRTYAVLAKRGNKYKVDGPSGKKFYHRDDLRITARSDKLTKQIIDKRGEELAKERAVLQQKRDAQQRQKDLEKKRVEKRKVVGKKIPKKK